MPLNKNASVSENIREIVHSYKQTGKIGNSKPRNIKEAIKQAAAIAYSLKRRK